MRRFLPILAAATALILPTTSILAHDDSGPHSGTVRFSPVEAVSMFSRSPDRPWLGVGVEEETKLPEGGARVTYVVGDSPAARAGIRQGDVIVSLGGDPVRGPAGLTAKLAEHEQGETVNITVMRDGKRQRLEADLEKPDLIVGVSPRWHDLGFSAFSARRPRFGVQLVDVTPELREHLGGSDEVGVLVSKVIPGTPAADGGIEVGDLIITLDGEAIENSRDLQRSVVDLEGRDVEIEVVRNGRATTLRVTFPAVEDTRPTGPRASVSWDALPPPPPPPAAAPVPAVVPVASPAPLPQVAAPPVVPPPPAPAGSRRVRLI